MSAFSPAPSERGGLPPDGFTVIDEPGSVPAERGALDNPSAQPETTRVKAIEPQNVTAVTSNKGTAGRQWSKSGSEFLADLETQHSNADHVPSLDNLIQEAGFVGRGKWDGIEGVYLIDSPDGTTRAMRVEDMTSADAIRRHMGNSAASPEAKPITEEIIPAANGDGTEEVIHVSPATYLEKVGADSSVIKGGSDQATVSAVRQAIRNGEPVEPVMVEYDKNGNVIGADGRHRALAAAQEGVERIPVILRRAGASPETVAQVGALRPGAQELLAETTQRQHTSQRGHGRPASDHSEVPVTQSRGPEGLREGSATAGAGRSNQPSTVPDLLESAHTGKPEAIERVLPDSIEAGEKEILQSEIKDLNRQRDEVRAKYEKAGTYSEASRPLIDRFNELTRKIHEREDRIATLSGEPTRAQKRDMQKQAAEKKFDERPAKAMKYGDAEQSQHWQVKEAEFIQKKLQSEIANYERGVKEQQAKVDALKNSKSIKRVTEEATLKHWQDRLAKLKSATPDPTLIQRFRDTYIKTVKDAISHGNPVPQEVIDQRPEFSKARDARERYEKGRHTSFANRSAAINDSMQSDRGYKVKRQDGKAITEEQMAEVERGVSDMESVFGGGLREAMRGTDLTVAHTSGKHPFLTGYGGLYHVADKTISTGLAGQNAFGHELAHWMDFESGKVLGAKATIYTKTGHKGQEVPSLAEANKHGQLISEATRTINDTTEVRRLFKPDAMEGKSETEKREIRLLKHHLGPYWREPREVFARLVEQYLAKQLGANNSATLSYERLSKAPGWWTKEQFDKLEPLVKAEIERRMNALREKYSSSGAAVETLKPKPPAISPIPAIRAKAAVEQVAPGAVKIETPKPETYTPEQLDQWAEQLRGASHSANYSTKYGSNKPFLDVLETITPDAAEALAERFRDDAGIRTGLLGRASDGAGTLEQRALGRPGVVQVQPNSDVPQNGRNFEGRYVKAALEDAKGQHPDAKQLLVKVPNDGKFVIDNTEAAIDRTIKATSKFAVSQPRESKGYSEPQPTQAGRLGYIERLKQENSQYDTPEEVKQANRETIAQLAAEETGTAERKPGDKFAYMYPEASGIRGEGTVAVATRVPGAIITRKEGFKKGYTFDIVHEGTGKKIGSGFRSLEDANRAVDAIADLPLDWSVKGEKELLAQWSKLPSGIKAALRNVFNPVPSSYIGNKPDYRLDEGLSQLATAKRPSTHPLPAMRRAPKPPAAPAKTSMPPGPGAMNAQSSVENEAVVSNIAQLTEAINRMDPKASDPRNAIGTGRRMAETFSNGKDKVSAAWERVKGTAAGLWAAYRHPGEWTDYKDLTGKWQAAEQVSDWELQRFADSIKTAMPDKARREAISNYIEANGNVALLKKRAEATRDPKLRRGYELAQNLTPEERLLADNIRNFQDSELQEAINAGVMEAGVENYVEHIWSKTPDHGKRIMAEVNFGALKTDPEFAKKRVYGTYFEGEQKGAVPLDKDVAFLVAAHHKAFAKALSSRAYIKSLLEGNASDGRPLAVVSGGGQPIGRGNLERFPITGIRAGESEASAYVIRPKSKPLTPEAQKESNRLRREMNDIEAQLRLSDSTQEKAEAAQRRDAIQVRLRELREGEQYNTGDYRIVNHPALRKWKVATVDENGKPILVQSDIIVHPEVMQKVQNNLGTSALRRFEIQVARKTVHPIAGLMRVSSEFKQTMLSLSAFHQTTVGVHALEHRTNPFSPVDLNLNDPKQRALVEHGLMVANFDAMAEFSEGLSTSGGLVAKIPAIGPKIQAYTQYLFRSYIPRLKMSMALHAAERNFERYGDKLAPDQVYEMTANQANAAFGELNYKMMGRSKTTQDVLRLTLLAPDFLEARGRFVGQGLKPYGREQLEALALGAGVMYAGGRILNQMLDDSPHWDRPFSLVVKGREYQMRTVQGDVWHLVGDPRGFVFNRLNPMTTRVAVEAVTGRDSQGRKRDFEQQFTDLAKQIIPIPGQSFVNAQGEPLRHKVLKTVLQSVGVNEKKFRSKAEQLAHKYYIGTLPANLKENEHSPDYAKFRRAISDDELDRKEVEDAYKRGRITADERARILRDANTPQLVREFGRLGKDEKLEVWNAMTDEERKLVRWTPSANPKRSALPPWLRGRR